MSTNYYVRPPGTPDAAEGIHLGKYAGGNEFHFRAYPDANDRPAEVTWDVVDFGSWIRLLALGEIETEYRRLVSVFEMVETVLEARTAQLHPYSLAPKQFRDEHGNRFSPYEFC